MKIQFKSTKTCKCYREFVEDPTNRSKRRAFSKLFAGLEDESVKLHKRLLSFENAGIYNQVYGQTANRIELKAGEKQKDPLILKIRISGSYRKFFNQIVDDLGNLLLVKDWSGDFNSIQEIYVIDVNNHDYKAV